MDNRGYEKSTPDQRSIVQDLSLYQKLYESFKKIKLLLTFLSI